jgi:Ig-like domain from next to BRCA1 gene
VTPNTQFTQSWLLENNGLITWPEGCFLKLVSEINNDGKMFVPQISPQDTHILTITLVSPPENGQFKSQFCMCTPTGATFGPIIWSVVDVSAAGTLALTQQLTELHTSNPKIQQPQQQIGCVNWEDDGMECSTALSNTVTALVPHCSNLISGSGSYSNQVNHISIYCFQMI